MVRVYPCAVTGGPQYVKAITVPMPMIPLIAAGGVSLQTAAEFLAAGAAAVGVAGDLLDLDALRGGRTEEILTNARLSLDVIAQARTLAG